MNEKLRIHHTDQTVENIYGLIFFANALFACREQNKYRRNVTQKQKTMSRCSSEIFTFEKIVHAYAAQTDSTSNS